MSAISPASMLGSGTPTGIARPKDAASAAEQFESLLINQLLKSASTDGGWLGTGEEDSAGLQAVSLAQEQLASALAAQGGLGLAKIIEPQLKSQFENHLEETR